MHTIKNIAELKEVIFMLEVQQVRQKIELKEHFQTTYRSFSPLNLVKSTFKEFTSSPDLATNLLNIGLGLATGFVTKKVLLGGTHNPIFKILGTLVELGVAGVVTKHPDGIKSAGLNVFKKIFSRDKG
jgi:hypothetical protein